MASFWFRTWRVVPQSIGQKNIKTIRTCHPEKKRDKIVRYPARQSEHRISRTPVYPCPCEPEHIIRSCVRLGFEMYSTPPQFSCSSRVSDPIYAADADDYAALPASLLPTRLAAYRRHVRVVRTRGQRGEGPRGARILRQKYSSFRLPSVSCSFRRGGIMRGGAHGPGRRS